LRDFWAKRGEKRTSSELFFYGSREKIKKAPPLSPTPRPILPVARVRAHAVDAGGYLFAKKRAKVEGKKKR
jgi:hypothetical protein